ncbi:MAG: BatD family protein [Rikenellaceae bacterium]
MRRLAVKISLAVAALLITLVSFAQSATTFTTNAPMKVAVGETFRIEFALNAQPEDDSFKAPSFDGFDVIAGPAISRGSSVQIINGSMTKSVNFTYTFVVIANAEGTNNIGAASVKVDGKEYSTSVLPIEVISESDAGEVSSSQQSQSGSGGSGSSAAQSARSQGDRIAEDDILLRTVVSRTSLFKGEPLRATIKLYSRVAIAGAENQKMPSFNGFWSQDIKGSNSEIQRETYNGKVYETQVLSDYLLYPQQSGKLTIDPASMTVVAQVRVRSRNVDPFFGGGYEIVNVRRAISTSQITIDVKNLPAGAPASFSGAVGNFSMESSLSSEEVTTNSSLAYTVRISGTGNLSLIQAPDVALPTTFEKYNVKTTESINTNVYGASGYKQFEYPIIPRSEGEFDLQPTTFSFFNPQSMKYETLTSPTFHVVVLPDGDNRVSSDGATVRRALSREDVKLLGEDIRFIKIDDGAFRKKRQPFFLSRGYYASLVAIILLFIAAYILLRRYIRESQNSILIRGKRANKVAIQRFKAASAFMNSHDEKAFYKEVLSAIWGYMSDKFNIPVANLTKESVRKELAKRGVGQELIANFSDIVTLCDEAQYSPMASAQMNEIYMKALKMISNIETEIKR